MAIIRFEPFIEIDTLRYRLDKLFDSMDATRVPAWTRQENWLPPVEVSETNESVQLQIALPGLDEDDLDIYVSQRAVMISGEYPEPTRQESEHLVSSEFLYDKFRRVISLDTKVKNTAAEANMRNGLLTLTMPKAGEARDRVFRVKLSESQIAEQVDIS